MGLIVTLSLLVILLSSVHMVQLLTHPEAAGAEDASPGAEETESIRQFEVTLQDDADCSVPSVKVLPVEADASTEQACEALLSDVVVRVHIDSYETSSRCTGVVIAPNGYVLAGCGGLREAEGIRCAFADGRVCSAAWF